MLNQLAKNGIPVKVKNQKPIDNLSTVFLAVGGLYLGIEKGWFWLVILCKVYLYLIAIGLIIILFIGISLLFSKLFKKKKPFDALKEVEKMK